MDHLYFDLPFDPKLKMFNIDQNIIVACSKNKKLRRAVCKVINTANNKLSRMDKNMTDPHIWFLYLSSVAVFVVSVFVSAMFNSLEALVTTPLVAIYVLGIFCVYCRMYLLSKRHLYLVEKEEELGEYMEKVKETWERDYKIKVFVGFKCLYLRIFCESLVPVKGKIERNSIHDYQTLKKK